MTNVNRPAGCRSLTARRTETAPSKEAVEEGKEAALSIRARLKFALQRPKGPDRNAGPIPKSTVIEP